MYKYKFTNRDWNETLSFLNNTIDTYVNSTVGMGTVCSARAIKEWLWDS